MSSTMALARAFTKRAKRSHEPANRGGIDRSMISLPTELISTTNAHALTAPDIRSLSNGSSASSSNSINSNQDSDFSPDRPYLSTPGLSPDSSSIDSSPVTPHNDQLRGFFDTNPKRSATTAGSRISDELPPFETPAIPQRALSHSKKAHVELSRNRSIQRLSPPPTTLTKPASSAHNGGDKFMGAVDPAHPFGKELAQVNEVAEGFGATLTVLDEEEQELLNKGFKKFGVEDYLDEIAGLYGGVFDGTLGPLSRPWG